VVDRPLAGRAAVVTGGSRGIGAGVARALAGQGANVVIASRKYEACAALAGDLHREYGVETLPIAFNASNWADNDRLIEAANDRFGSVRILINNAGMSPRYDAITEVTEALFDKVIGVNLRSPFRLCAVLGSQMATGEGGAIVNVGSIAALRPDPLALPYSAAKSGLHSLTEGFAQLLGPRVRVNTVHPGPILTDIAEGWADGAKETHERHLALSRCGTVDEVVDAILYLVGDGATYVTGACLRVDGGWP
jgi:NAD(P)-dependent dehydrogenase (short-subunit alcohol dehydrogenase family)